MVDARVLLLALALESSAGNNPKHARFGRRKTAYVATLVVRPEEYRLFGFVDTETGIDLLWQHTGTLRIRRFMAGCG